MLGIGGWEKMTELTVDFILERMNDYFEEPCNWTLNGIAADEYMIENHADWCNEHCGEEGVGVQCWMKFFQSIAERRAGEDGN